MAEPTKAFSDLIAKTYDDMVYRAMKESLRWPKKHVWEKHPDGSIKYTTVESGRWDCPAMTCTNCGEAVCAACDSEMLDSECPGSLA